MLFLPLDSFKSYRSWNEDAVIARILHFKEKTQYVQELIVQDAKSILDEDGPEFLPESIIPALMGALERATRVASVVFEGPQRAVIPRPVWSWISRKQLRFLAVDHEMSIPSDAEACHVSAFEGGFSLQSMRVYEVCLPSI